MSVIADFSITRFDDGVLSVSLAPPAPISAWNIQFEVARRFGGDAFYKQYYASGYNAVSGISITNSGQGVFNVPFFGSRMSGMDCGNYAYKITRTGSGVVTTLSEGYIIWTP